MAHIRLQSIQRQNHATLAGQALPQAHRIGQVQRDQFFIAVQQHGHAALSNGDAALAEPLMELGHAALVAGAQLANEHNDVQAERALRQRPRPGFLRHHRPMILRAVRVHTLPHPQCQAPEPIEAHHRAMVMVGDPQPLPTRAALLALRAEHLLVRGRCSAPATSHRIAPFPSPHLPPVSRLHLLVKRALLP